MMTNQVFCRRFSAKLGLGVAFAASFLSMPGLHLASTARAQESLGADSPGVDERALAAAINRAYSFLNTMMDAYAQDTVIRLSQSYSDQQGLESTAFVYDNSLVINAHLLRGQPEDIDRAIELGKAFLHAQQVDSIGDGRVRQAYFVNQPDSHSVCVRTSRFPFFFF